MAGRIVTLGEIMLRLKSPDFERFFQSPALEATFGGGEGNVAISLAIFGLDVAYVTALPQNPIAEACIRFLRGYGVDTSFIQRSGERVGIYFLEGGANQRPSNVVYDRANSAIATVSADSFAWDEIFAGAGWFHITGITPAISQSAAHLSLAAVQAAKTKGLTVSCDYNFRKKLWQYGKTAPEVMSELVKYVDVGIANGEDCQKSLWVSLAEDDWESAVATGELDTPAMKRSPKRCLPHSQTSNTRPSPCAKATAPTTTAGQPACTMVGIFWSVVVMISPTLLTGSVVVTRLRRA